MNSSNAARKRSRRLYQDRGRASFGVELSEIIGPVAQQAWLYLAKIEEESLLLLTLR